MAMNQPAVPDLEALGGGATMDPGKGLSSIESGKGLHTLEAEKGLHTLEAEKGLYTVEAKPYQDGLIPTRAAAVEEPKYVVPAPVPPPPPPPPPPETICGLRKRTFWIIAILVLVLLSAAAVAAGILGSRKATGSHPVSVTSNSTSATDVVQKASLPRNSTAITVSTPIQDVNDYMIIYQSVSGDLYFSLLSSPTPALVQTDFKARNGTPLSSGLWVDAKGATETYLYYIAEDNILSDAIYAGGKWASGNLRNIKLKPHPESKLASVLWLEGAGKSSQWVYFQDNDGYILEYGRLMGVGNAWNGGPDNSSEVSLQAMAGSGIGLSYDLLGRASQRLRIYAQVLNGTVVSRDYSSQLAQKWLDPYPVYTPPTTNPNEKIVDISAATERNGNGELLSIRLLFAAQEGRLRELSFDNSTGWNTVPLDVAVKTQAKVAAGVSQGNNITAYFQEAGEEALSLANLGPDGRWNVRTAGIN